MRQFRAKGRPTSLRAARSGLCRLGGLHGPGNFATNLAGGAEHGYQLVWVIILAKPTPSGHRDEHAQSEGKEFDAVIVVEGQYHDRLLDRVRLDYSIYIAWPGQSLCAGIIAE